MAISFESPITLPDSQGQVLFQGRATADQILTTHNTWYSVALDTEDFDTHDGHDNTTNNSRWTAPTTGTYLVIGVALFKFGGSISNTPRGVRLAVNGTVVNNSSRWDIYSATELLSVQVTQLVSMTAEDYVELQAVTGDNASNDNTRLFGQSTDGSMLIVKSAFI